MPRLFGPRCLFVNPQDFKPRAEHRPWRTRAPSPGFAARPARAFRQAGVDPHVKRSMPEGEDPKEGETSRELAEKMLGLSGLGAFFLLSGTSAGHWKRHFWESSFPIFLFVKLYWHKPSIMSVSSSHTSSDLFTSKYKKHVGWYSSGGTCNLREGAIGCLGHFPRSKGIHQVGHAWSLVEGTLLLSTPPFRPHMPRRAPFGVGPRRDGVAHVKRDGAAEAWLG